MNFDWNVTEASSLGSDLQYPSIASDNGLVPTRRQAIVWTNNDKIAHACMRHLASMI